MSKELKPDDVLEALAKGNLAPFYLFYGLGEFRLERALDQIRETFIPLAIRDFNLEIFYGDESDSAPGEIINRSRTLPFMSPKRLIIVRRTESFNAGQLENFLPYLAKPSDLTCLIFVSQKTDFKRKFYKTIRDAGLAVHFEALKENEVMPWIRRTARELGLNIEVQACDYLRHLVGNSLRDLSIELEKLYVRYGDGKIGVEQVEEIAIHSRMYSVFQLIDEISAKKCAASLLVLKRFLEEEDKKRAPLQIVGMLNRQIRLLWQSKPILEAGGKIEDMMKQLDLHNFYSAKKLAQHSQNWKPNELERALCLLGEADGLLKSGSPPNLILENLILAVCGGYG